MDIEGIFWIVLWFIIALVAFIKLKTTSSSSKKTSNQNNNDSRKSYHIGSTTERKQGFSKCVSFLKYRHNKCCDASNDKAGNCDNEDSFNHSKASIAGRKNDSQPK